MYSRANSPDFGSAQAQPGVSPGVSPVIPPSSQRETTPARTVPMNPFRVNLSEPTTNELDVFSPPPYEDTGVPTPVEKPRRDSNEHQEGGARAPSAADENYRRGLEEGMRIAKEKERQKRRERRRMHEEREKERANRHGESSSRSNGEHSQSKQPSSGSKSGESRPHNRRSHSDGHRSSSADAERRKTSSRSTRKRSQTSSNTTQPPESLDVIDKMDVTGIYGSSRFHHDGPFDACAPHRNQAGKRGAATPMSAFPVDGPNNSLAVEDPALAAYRTTVQVYGQDAESIPPELAQSSFDPTDRGVKLHGQRTMGLGSTTFIDGTPATQSAIEDAREQRESNLNRSKSLFRQRSHSTEMGEPKSLISRVRSLRVPRH